MSKVDALLFWFQALFQTEDPLERRIDVIRGQRLYANCPKVQVFIPHGGPSIGR